MNKLVVGAIVGVVVIGGIGTVLVVGNKDDTGGKVDTTNIKTGSDAIINVDACDVLTDAVAKQVLGDGAEKGDTSAGAASSDDVSVTNCVYTYKAITTGSVKDQLASTDHAGLLVRSAKTKAGADSNKAPFTSAKPGAAQDVNGYGDKAYFNPTMGQLNVLKGGNWYIISRYKGTSSTKATLDDVKQLADVLKDNLK